MQQGERICVGVVLGAHGIRGAVRIRSYTDDPADVAAYGPVSAEGSGRSFTLTLQGAAKDKVVIARMSGIADRTAAEGMKGIRLMVPRSALPPTEEEEFYHSDLIGLVAEHIDGSPLGVVKAVLDFGGGDILEVKGPQGTALYAFTRATVPVIDLAGRRVVIDPPSEVAAGGPQDGGEDDGPDTAEDDPDAGQ